MSHMSLHSANHRPNSGASRSIWKKSNKFRLQPSLATSTRKKNYIVWTKSSESVVGGWRATCIKCKRTFVALSKHQMHLVSTKSGECFSCRDKGKWQRSEIASTEIDSNEQKWGGIIDKSYSSVHPPALEQQVLKGYVGRPSSIHQMWSKGDQRSLDPSKIHESHLGRLCESKMPFCKSSLIRKLEAASPVYSCCYQSVDSVRPCAKAIARQKLLQREREYQKS